MKTALHPIKCHERKIPFQTEPLPKLESADAYEAHLKNTVLPGLKQVPGYRGGYVLRSDGRDEVEFVVINFFDSLESVKLFAGEDYSVAVFEPEARALLSRVEPEANHYEVRAGSVSLPS